MSTVVFLALDFGFYQNLKAGEYNYPEVFGNNWKRAELFVSENNVWMSDLLSENKVDYQLVLSMIFPELVRYSAIRDRMEITLLKALYVHNGTDYANFSVGVFQIKPSCAEEILSEIPSLHDKKWTALFKAINSSISENEKRSIIVAELEEPKSQLLYVISLVKILDKRFRNHKWDSVLDKVKFYAAAYNGGFSNSETYIRQKMNATSFHTGLIKSDNHYCYADIAAYYYQN
ncbi:MAG: hypothetical protein WC384_06690 [Prolixibacteraceae bacterium]